MNFTFVNHSKNICCNTAKYVSLMVMEIYVKKRVLFICKQRQNYGSYGYGCYGLTNSARFVSDYLNSINIESKVVNVIDNNCIDKEVYSFKPTHVIIEALWVVPVKFYELIKLHPKVKWIIRIHSKAAFLANEGIAFTWLTGYRDVQNRYPTRFFISANHEEFNNNLADVLSVDCVYLPNIYFINKPASNHIYKHPGINIACFGAIRPMKNQLAQAIAAILFANPHGRMNFHMNAYRVEQRGEEVIKNIRALFTACPQHRLIEHSWMPHDQFISFVKTMDIGMQVSLTESFNIVAADFANNNIPLVGCPEIEWMSPIFQADPNSIDNMVKVLNLAWSTRYLKTHYLNLLG